MSLEKKKIKVWYRQEDRHPNKTPKWILLVSICPCDYLMETDMFSSSMQDSLCHERSVSTSELGICWLAVIAEADTNFTTSLHEKLDSKHLHIPLPLQPLENSYRNTHS